MKAIATRNSKRAFSLVEMLVAMAVFSILIVMVTQMLNSAATMASLEHKRMDSEDQARLVFSRMAIDFDKMVKRGDIDSIFAINTGNDSFYFYSEAPAVYDPNSTAYTATGGQSLLKNSLSLIGYRINSNYQLERLGKALNYDNIGTGPFSVFLTVPPATSTNPTPTPLPTSTISGVWGTGGVLGNIIGAGPTYTNGNDTEDYHVLGTDVFRMEICFQKSDGTYSQSHTSRDFSDVSSIVVTLAILDQTSRNIIPSGNLNAILSTAAGQLPDPTVSDLTNVPPKLPAKNWTSIVNSSNTFAGATGMPSLVASQVRVYQEYFYLNSIL